MPYCPHCGHEIKQGAGICPSCGERIAKPGVRGLDIFDGGTPENVGVKEDTRPSLMPSQIRRRRELRNTWIWGILGFLLLINLIASCARAFGAEEREDTVSAPASMEYQSQPPEDETADDISDYSASADSDGMSVSANTSMGTEQEESDPTFDAANGEERDGIWRDGKEPSEEEEFIEGSNPGVRYHRYDGEQILVGDEWLWVPNGAGFIVYDSDIRPIGSDDLMGLSNTQLWIARNEIFARHGYEFKTPDLQRWFDKMYWYKPSSSPSDLSDVEKENVEYIRWWEVKANSPYVK